MCAQINTIQDLNEKSLLLKFLREEKNLSQDEVAHRLGMNPKTYSRKENSGDLKRSEFILIAILYGFNNIDEFDAKILTIRKIIKLKASLLPENPGCHEEFLKNDLNK